MKALTNSIKPWLEGMDTRWQQVPAKDARRIIAYSFGGYVLITLAVLVQIVCKVSTSKSSMEIKHITNPVTVKANKKINELKTEDYERE
ncbi:hypothetical protein FMM05_13430 [Flavobacterium zepuense]|uniref:Nitrogen regulatory IIA protein n=1 Tax=Flavobacterium zepuense TaxID=2593302 RepID=A0A552UZK4_9FLAO|nr:hypothetical protein [Flavobacterium zepuense]TRW23656.1 hypothetical protein FMM05_13430 [Flavobacterium zepuense]